MASEEIGSVPGSHPPLKQWLQSAAQKFSRGFVLLINKEKRTAKFFKPGKGYHACPYRMAILLVQHGMVTAVRPHPLHGTVFSLAEGVTPAVLRALNPDDALDQDDDDDDLQDGTDDGDELDVDLDDDEVAEDEEDEPERDD